MNGLAITIIVGQLPKLCGFSTDADGFVDELQAFVDGFAGRNPTALWLGLATLAVLLVLPRATKTIPAVLVAVIGATVVTGLFDLDIATVGALPQGLPRPALPWTEVGDLAPMLVAAIGITLVSLTDTIATSTSFAARRGEEVDPNQEMIGIGTANIAAGCFQGFAVSTSGSRTAVADQTGAKSQLTGVIGAGVVALLLLIFNGLLADLPQTALAAVVIAAALSLADLRTIRRYYDIRQDLVPALSRRDGRRRLLRRVAGHPHRRRTVDPALLPAQLVAARRSTGQEAATATGTPSPRRRRPNSPTACWSSGGRRRCSSRTRACSASRFVTWSVKRQPTMGRAPVRGDHRHRRHGSGDTRTARRGN